MATFSASTRTAAASKTCSRLTAPTAQSLGDLTLIGSTLYGMTAIGGANSNGNIFSINTDGSGFKNLLSFTGTGGAYPGACPSGGLDAHRLNPLWDDI